MKSLLELSEVNLNDLLAQLFSNVDAIPSVEAAAQMLVKKMYETLKTDSTSEIVLARFFHSFQFRALPPDLQERAIRTVGSTPTDDSVFLTLLGTYGDETSWQRRRDSQRHQTIPLTRESIRQIPMMARIFQQIGFDLGILLGEGSPGISVSGVEKTYGIFYVKDADGSPYIPAQDFVAKYGVKSVIGTGAMLPTNDVSIFIAFCRIDLDEVAASRIAPLVSLFWQRMFSIIDKGFFS